MMRDVDPDGRPTLGWQVIGWIERHLVHGPGDVQGDPIELDDEMAAFVLRAYALDAASGRRLYDEALLSRPKGRAKSELAGMLVCAEALGPVRFDGWDSDGDPVGRPVTYPYIRCLATEEGQSGNTYDNVSFMLDHVSSEFGDEYPGIDLGKGPQSSTRVLLPGGGEIVPSTASSAAKDGGKESFAVCDETHLYVLPELVRMYRTVKRNLAKRRGAQPWLLQTSTMFSPGENSVAEATHTAIGKRQAPRLLFDHRGARRHVGLADTAALLEELRYVYGPAAAWMDMERLLGELRDPTAEEPDQRRYFLNEEVKGASRWIAKAAWAALARPEVVVADRAPITLGLDGSITQDATALVACTRDGHLFTLGIWERPPGAAGEDWRVPPHEVDVAVSAAFDRWRVVRFYGDPAWWQAWLATWAARYGDDRVLAWWTNRDAPWARALRAFHTAVHSQPAGLSHDGDSRLAQHIANAHKRPTRIKDEEGRPLYVIQKDRPLSPHKIDGAVAATLALAARNDALTAGQMADEAPDAEPFAVWAD